jgi:hypothetical protein
MNLQTTLRRILIEEVKKDLSPMMEKLLNHMLVDDNRDIICGVKVKHPDNRTKLPHSDNKYLSYRVDITFIGGYGTKFFPQTQAVQIRYDNLLDELWDIIYNFTGHGVDIFPKYIKECE